MPLLLKHIKVPILPKTYNEVMSEATQLSFLKKALIEEIVESRERGLQFSGIYFLLELMLANCENVNSAEWLASNRTAA